MAPPAVSRRREWEGRHVGLAYDAAYHAPRCDQGSVAQTIARAVDEAADALQEAAAETPRARSMLKLRRGNTTDERGRREPSVRWGAQTSPLAASIDSSAAPSLTDAAGSAFNFAARQIERKKAQAKSLMGLSGEDLSRAVHTRSMRSLRSSTPSDAVPSQCTAPQRALHSSVIGGFAFDSDGGDDQSELRTEGDDGDDRTLASESPTSAGRSSHFQRGRASVRGGERGCGFFGEVAYYLPGTTAAYGRILDYVSPDSRRLTGVDFNQGNTKKHSEWLFPRCDHILRSTADAAALMRQTDGALRLSRTALAQHRADERPEVASVHCVSSDPSAPPLRVVILAPPSQGEQAQEARRGGSPADAAARDLLVAACQGAWAAVDALLPEWPLGEQYVAALRAAERARAAASQRLRQTARAAETDDSDDSTPPTSPLRPLRSLRNLRRLTSMKRAAPVDRDTDAPRSSVPALSSENMLADSQSDFSLQLLHSDVAACARAASMRNVFGAAGDVMVRQGVDSGSLAATPAVDNLVSPDATVAGKYRAPPMTPPAPSPSGQSQAGFAKADRGGGGLQRERSRRGLTPEGFSLEVNEGGLDAPFPQAPALRLAGGPEGQDECTAEVPPSPSMAAPRRVSAAEATPQDPDASECHEDDPAFPPLPLPVHTVTTSLYTLPQGQAGAPRLHVKVAAEIRKADAGTDAVYEHCVLTAENATATLVRRGARACARPLAATWGVPALLQHKSPGAYVVDQLQRLPHSPHVLVAVDVDGRRVFAGLLLTGNPEGTQARSTILRSLYIVTTTTRRRRGERDGSRTPPPRGRRGMSQVGGGSVSPLSPRPPTEATEAVPTTVQRTATWASDRDTAATATAPSGSASASVSALRGASVRKVLFQGKDEPLPEKVRQASPPPSSAQRSPKGQRGASPRRRGRRNGIVARAFKSPALDEFFVQSDECDASPYLALGIGVLVDPDRAGKTLVKQVGEAFGVQLIRPERSLFHVVRMVVVLHRLAVSRRNFKAVVTQHPLEHHVAGRQTVVAKGQVVYPSGKAFVHRKHGGVATAVLKRVHASHGMPALMGIGEGSAAHHLIGNTRGWIENGQFRLTGLGVMYPGTYRLEVTCTLPPPLPACAVQTQVFRVLPDDVTNASLRQHALADATLRADDVKLVVCVGPGALVSKTPVQVLVKVVSRYDDNVVILLDGHVDVQLIPFPRREAGPQVLTFDALDEAVAETIGSNPMQQATPCVTPVVSSLDPAVVQPASAVLSVATLGDFLTSARGSHGDAFAASATVGGRAPDFTQRYTFEAVKGVGGSQSPGGLPMTPESFVLGASEPAAPPTPATLAPLPPPAPRPQATAGSGAFDVALIGSPVESLQDAEPDPGDASGALQRRESKIARGCGSFSGVPFDTGTVVPVAHGRSASPSIDTSTPFARYKAGAAAMDAASVRRASVVPGLAGAVAPLDSAHVPTPLMVNIGNAGTPQLRRRTVDWLALDACEVEAASATSPHSDAVSTRPSPARRRKRSSSLGPGPPVAPVASHTVPDTPSSTRTRQRASTVTAFPSPTCRPSPLSQRAQEWRRSRLFSGSEGSAGRGGLVSPAAPRSRGSVTAGAGGSGQRDVHGVYLVGADRPADLVDVVAPRFARLHGARLRGEGIGGGLGAASHFHWQSLEFESHGGVYIPPTEEELVAIAEWDELAAAAGVCTRRGAEGRRSAGAAAARRDRCVVFPISGRWAVRAQLSTPALGGGPLKGIGFYGEYCVAPHATEEWTLLEDRETRERLQLVCDYSRRLIRMEYDLLCPELWRARYYWDGVQVWEAEKQGRMDVLVEEVHDYTPVLHALYVALLTEEALLWRYGPPQARLSEQPPLTRPSLVIDPAPQAVIRYFSGGSSVRTHRVRGWSARRLSMSMGPVTTATVPALHSCAAAEAAARIEVLEEETRSFWGAIFAIGCLESLRLRCRQGPLSRRSSLRQSPMLSYDGFHDPASTQPSPSGRPTGGVDAAAAWQLGMMSLAAERVLRLQIIEEEHRVRWGYTATLRQRWLQVKLAQFRAAPALNLNDLATRTGPHIPLPLEALPGSTPATPAPDTARSVATCCSRQGVTIVKRASTKPDAQGHAEDDELDASCVDAMARLLTRRRAREETQTETAEALPDEWRGALRAALSRYPPIAVITSVRLERLLHARALAVQKVMMATSVAAALTPLVRTNRAGDFGAMPAAPRSGALSCTSSGHDDNDNDNDKPNDNDNDNGKDDDVDVDVDAGEDVTVPPTLTADVASTVSDGGSDMRTPRVGVGFAGSYGVDSGLEVRFRGLPESVALGENVRIEMRLHWRGGAYSLAPLPRDAMLLEVLSSTAPAMRLGGLAVSPFFYFTASGVCVADVAFSHAGTVQLSAVFDNGNVAAAGTSPPVEVVGVPHVINVTAAATDEGYRLAVTARDLNGSPCRRLAAPLEVSWHQRVAAHTWRPLPLPTTTAALLPAVLTQEGAAVVIPFFHFRWCPPGTYRFVAAAAGLQGVSQTVKVAGAKSTTGHAGAS